ncbi:unnamed protein product [Rotaria sordida]|uniref:EF-hand domain-containing protein n=1 Tax=Rotaria sordida TaxID=392033 RepID=A0A814JDK1_9BILA|nr:unnamed protein product [Rotaria sordida]CAF1033469.1 unnamed protein product [Rotaria sordida]CAF1034454.1 unnamed protein product [Rotaria sordida]CAF1217049.1 unnamed protein product [Rotaria sordida]CAF3772039.1 unnamed protein product [Rotaria sordida]
MANNDTADTLFKHIDTNRDGRIDQSEFRNWCSSNEALTASNESINRALDRYDDTTGQFGRYRYTDSYQDDLNCMVDKYSSYGTRRWIDDTVIDTNSAEETNYYLEKSGTNIYHDPNPKIIRRARSASPVTLEQRVHVRYFQPPAIPPPGPLIIKEVRPRQPSPPPPLVIREHAPPLPSSPPIILRERPPTPPKHIPSETITRTLPALPVPPRSVIIERFPPPPEKPRDIIIERWIPYGPQPERRTIVEPAPPAREYERPSNTIVIYSALETRTVRKFENLGVTPEDPESYRARYGGSLLDSVTLVQQARNIGVTEDITPPGRSSSLYTNTSGYSGYYSRSNDIINRDYSSTVRTNIEKYQ